MRRSLVLAALMTLGSNIALAEDVTIPVQGYLEDVATGLPISGNLPVTFRIYPTSGTAAADYTESNVLVSFTDGRFSAYLGVAGGLDSELFSQSQTRFLGISIDGGPEMDRIRLGFVPYAAYAANASNAETIDGFGSADFLGADYQPQWSDIIGIPPDILDGDDVGGGVTYVAGVGIIIDGSTNAISLSAATVETLARGVCFDTVTELRNALDAVYLAPTQWSEILGMPAGFADGIDDVLSNGQVLGIIEGASSLDLPPNTTIGGNAPYTNADTQAFIASQYPQLGAPLGRDPLMVFGFVEGGCKPTSGDGNYGAAALFPTNFSQPPLVFTTIDEMINDSGADYTRQLQTYRNRFYIRCNNRSDALSYLAIEPGIHTIDGKAVQAGNVATVSSNNTIFFPETFTEPPVVLLQTVGTSAWQFITGAGQVTTQGFQVTVHTNGQPLNWIAFTQGSYDYGPYHFEAGVGTNISDNQRYPLSSTFSVEPHVLMSIGELSTAGTAYVRLRDVTLSDFQIHANSNASEFLYYLAWEERR